MFENQEQLKELLSELLEEKNYTALKNQFFDLHPADCAAVFEG